MGRPIKNARNLKPRVEETSVIMTPEDQCILKDCLEKYNESKAYMRDFTIFHHQYQKIRQGKAVDVYEKKDKDGKNLIRPLSTSKLSRVVKQLAQRIVQGEIATELATPFTPDKVEYHIQKYIVERILLQDSTNDPSAFLVKLSAMVQDALSYAVSTALVQYEYNGEDPKIKLKPINYGDTFPEPNKDSPEEINWCIVRLWYSEYDLKQMCDCWDNVQAVINAGEDNKFDTETKSSDGNDTYSNQKGYPIFMYTETGKKGNIVYFSEKANCTLAVIPNPDPKGQMRVSFLVNDQDSQGALGHSIFENTKEIQAAMDRLFQLFNWSFELEMDPPVTLSGMTMTGSPIYYRPGHVNRLMQGALLQPTRTTNQVPQTVGAAQQMLSGIISDATGINDMSVPSANSDAGLSKTDTGIKAQQAILDIVTNYYDLRMKAFISDYITKAYSTFVSYSKKVGVKSIFIDDYKTIEAIMAIDEGAIIDISTGEYIPDWEKLKLNKVSVSIGPSDFGSPAEKAQALQQVLNVINSAQGDNPVLLGIVEQLLDLFNLKDDNNLRERIVQWQNQQIEKERLNRQQSQMQIAQMQTQLVPMQIQSQEAMSNQQLQDLLAQQTLQLQILQTQAQIAQTQQMMQNPQAMQQQPPM